MAELLKRSEVNKEFTWNLEEIFASDAEWREEYDALAAETDGFKGFKGRLAESAETLMNYLNFREKYLRRLTLVQQYAWLHAAEDTTNSSYNALDDKAETLAAKAMAENAFFEPEILAVGRERIDGFIAQNGGLEVYRHFFRCVFMNEGHILSEKEEALLARAAKMAGTADNVFSMLENADMKFGKIKDKDGKEHELTTGKYISYLESEDRVLRENAYDALYGVFIGHKHTIAATYAGSVEGDMFFSKSRNFPSSMEASLFADNVSVDVYKNLIAAVHKHLPQMYRYVELRKKRLGLDKLRFYDMYTPIVSGAESNISYEDALETVLKALAPLGEDYVAIVREGAEKRWIDVYENAGKRGGAFSSGCYDSMPYILLNYDGKISDMFTLAHELGHSLHSYYSNREQAFVNSHYPIFLAEVASTVNEALLMDYLLKTTKDEKTRAYLLNEHLEQFRGTLFRQTMFAEFEMMTHEAAESGEALTVDWLSETYRGLVGKYFGPEAELDDKIPFEWSRIPHFYSAFYVYKYATGHSAAVAFAKKILGGKPEDVAAYKNFLKSGGSDFPLELLKKAGVDMSAPEPVNSALDMFAEILEQLEKSPV